MTTPQVQRATARASAPRRLRLASTLLVMLLCLPSTGCLSIGLTLLGAGVGIGAGTAVSYTLNGMAYRTFTAPLATVQRATEKALRDMGMNIDAKEEDEPGMLIHASGVDRTVEVRLEPISEKTTRIRSVVSMGAFLKDKATATEIIIQTERVLVERG